MKNLKHISFLLIFTWVNNIFLSMAQPATFDQQGHRGARGLMPENTIAAMRFALGLPIQTLEMDVVISKDKQVVLSHDPFFHHEISSHPDGRPVLESEEKKLNLYAMPYSEIRQYDVGLKPHPRFPKQQKMPAVKPLLAEVFDSIQADMMTRRRPMPFFNIETKCSPQTDGEYHPEPGEFVELLLQVIREKNMEDQCIIQSFDIRTLQYLHQYYPHIKTALLIDEGDARNLNTQIQELGFTPDIYSPYHELVSPELISQCHRIPMKIIPWTVNDPNRIADLKKMGVDGIISDYPDLF